MALPDDRRHTLADNTKDPPARKVVARGAPCPAPFALAYVKLADKLAKFLANFAIRGHRSFPMTTKGKIHDDGETPIIQICWS
jgi:hypothetical protein